MREKIASRNPEILVFDCNLRPEAIQAIILAALPLSIPSQYLQSVLLRFKADRVAFCDPTSIPKLPRLMSALLPLIPPNPASPRPLTHLSPNILELSKAHELLSDISDELASTSWDFINSLNLLADWRSKVEALSRKPGLDWIGREGIVQKGVALLPWIESLWIKAGKRGVVHIAIAKSPSKASRGTANISQKLDGVHSGKYLIVEYYESPSIKESEIVSTTGAGDTLVGGIVAGLVDGQEGNELVGRALDGVKRSLTSHRAVA